MTPRTIIVFVRAPEPGRVKTRLAAELGAPAALAIYRELGARAIRSADAVPMSERRVLYTPADGASAVRAWLGDGEHLLPQCDGDLGRRMTTAIADAFADGAARVVVIGSDCPALTSDLLAEAFARLDDHDAVIGPATDGGYYLIGVRAPQPALFVDIPWSSPDTLAVTLRAAARARLRVALLATLSDIDTADDWRRWSAAGMAPTDDGPVPALARRARPLSPIAQDPA